MKKWFSLEKKKRKSVEKKEIKKMVLKSIIKNKNVKKAWRWQAYIELHGNFSKKTKVSLVKRCLVTGRSRSVFKKLRLNRLEIFRKLKKGEIPGYKSLSIK